MPTVARASLLKSARTRRAPYRFTVEDFYRLSETGLLGSHDRIELLDGQLMLMMAVGPRHAGVVMRLLKLLEQTMGDQALVNAQNPVRLGPYSEPLSDVTLLRFRDDFYTTAHPRPAEVLLLIEVSDATLQDDRHRKVPLYAEAGIVEVWLLAPQQGYLEVYRQPNGKRYQTITQLFRGDAICPLSFPQHRLTVEQLLGPEG
jgi:Uma2 family endonuclease